jgi:hypothetical protein
MGEGTLDQVRRDLEALQELRAPPVLLDTKRNSPTALSSQHHEESWRTLTVPAEKAIDLEHETVRQPSESPGCHSLSSASMPGAPPR